jgi:hypothetical protein
VDEAEQLEPEKLQTFLQEDEVRNRGDDVEYESTEDVVRRDLPDVFVGHGAL